MILEYKYLVGFSSISKDKRGDIFSVDINSAKIRIQQFTTNFTTTDINRRSILSIEMDDRLIIKFEKWDGTHMNSIDNNVINNKLKSYHLYNRRKDIIESI